MSSDLASQRPYLLRAMHEWMTDGGQTPQIVVNALIDGVDVPEQHVQDGKIILNVSYAAVKNLSMGNDTVSFEARFGGKPCQISFPVLAVQGIYARETSQGMVFPDAGEASPVVEESSGGDNADKKKGRKKPGGSHLKIVK
jgi:stringent starvation protein B